MLSNKETNREEYGFDHIDKYVFLVDAAYTRGTRLTNGKKNTKKDQVYCEKQFIFAYNRVLKLRSLAEKEVENLQKKSEVDRYNKRLKQDEEIKKWGPELYNDLCEKYKDQLDGILNGNKTTESKRKLINILSKEVE